MAIKKFLMEGQKQVWPITRADCVYTVAGDKLLSVAMQEQHAALQKAIDDEAARAKAAEKANADEIANMKNADIEGSLANKIAANDAAIKQEVQDRKDAVKGVQDQLDALKGDGEGSVADQINDLKTDLEGKMAEAAQEQLEKDNAQDKALTDAIGVAPAEGVEGSGLRKEIADAVKAEKERAEGVESGHNERLEALETFKNTTQPAKDLEQDNRIQALENANAEGGAVANAIKAVQDALDDFEEAQATKDGQQDQAIQAAQNAADKAQQEVDALEVVVGNKAGTDAEGNTIEASGMMKDIAANAAAIAKEAGDRAAADTQIRTDFAAADATNLQAAKDYADQKDTADKEAQAAIDNAQNDRIKALEDANAEGGAVAEAIAAAQKAADDAQEAAEAAQADADALEQRLDADGGLVDRIEANEAFVAAQPDIDAEQDRRIKALEDDAPVKQTAIEAAQAAANAAQADVDAVEKRLDDEGGLVDRLEAVEQFVEDHDDTERDAQIAANKAAIEKLNGAADVEGSVAKAVKDAVDAEAALREAADNALDERVKPLEAHVAAQPGVDAAQDARIKALEDDKPLKEAAIKAAQDAADQAQGEVDAVEERATALEGRMDAVEEDVARLDGAVDVEGSVKKQIKDAIDTVNGNAEALEGRVAANEAKLAGLKKDTVQAAIDDAQAAAEAKAQNAQDAADSANEKIDAFLDANAVKDDTINTLKEIQLYIEEHGTEAAGMVDDITANAKAIEKLNGDENTTGSVAAAVKAEADRAKEAEGDLADRLDVLEGEGEGSVKKALADAKAHAEAQDTALHTTISAEIDADVKVVADELAKQKDAAQEGTLANQIKDENERAVAKENEIAENLADENERAVAAEEALGARIDSIFAAYDGDQEYDDLAPFA